MHRRDFIGSSISVLMLASAVPSSALARRVSLSKELNFIKKSATAAGGFDSGTFDPEQNAFGTLVSAARAWKYIDAAYEITGILGRLHAIISGENPGGEPVGPGDIFEEALSAADPTGAYSLLVDANKKLDQISEQLGSLNLQVEDVRKQLRALGADLDRNYNDAVIQKISSINGTIKLFKVAQHNFLNKIDRILALRKGSRAYRQEKAKKDIYVKGYMDETLRLYRKLDDSIADLTEYSFQREDPTISEYMAANIAMAFGMHNFMHAELSIYRPEFDASDFVAKRAIYASWFEKAFDVNRDGSIANHALHLSRKKSALLGEARNFCRGNIPYESQRHYKEYILGCIKVPNSGFTHAKITVSFEFDRQLDRASGRPKTSISAPITRVVRSDDEIEGLKGFDWVKKVYEDSNRCLPKQRCVEHTKLGAKRETLVSEARQNVGSVPAFAPVLQDFLSWRAVVYGVDLVDWELANIEKTRALVNQYGFDV